MLTIHLNCGLKNEDATDYHTSKNKALYGRRTHDLNHTGVALHQLS